MGRNPLPDVIVLNGASSSGKTSIAKALQDRLPELFLSFSIDTILYQLPSSDLSLMMKGDRIARAGYSYEKLVKGYHAAAAGLLDAGNRLILDNATVKDAWKADLQEQLRKYRAFWVGVHCDLPELARRERHRGDRAIGTAERESPLVHTGVSYQLIVDTTHEGPEQAAQAIIAALDPSLA